MFFNRFALAAAAALSVLACAPAQAGIKFFDSNRILGCGVVSDVKDVAQRPLYEARYEARVGGPATAASTTGQLAGANAITAGAAAVATAIFDIAASSSRPTPDWVLPETPVLDNVQSVRVTMDDGRELNLPLLKGEGGNLAYKMFKVGQRVTVFFHKVADGKTFYVYNTEEAASPDEKRYKWRCARTVPEAEAAEAFEYGANLAK